MDTNALDEREIFHIMRSKILQNVVLESSDLLTLIETDIIKIEIDFDEKAFLYQYYLWLFNNMRDENSADVFIIRFKDFYRKGRKIRVIKDIHDVANSYSFPVGSYGDDTRTRLRYCKTVADLSFTLLDNNPDEFWEIMNSARSASFKNRENEAFTS